MSMHSWLFFSLFLTIFDKLMELIPINRINLSIFKACDQCFLRSFFLKL